MKTAQPSTCSCSVHRCRRMKRQSLSTYPGSSIATDHTSHEKHEKQAVNESFVIEDRVSEMRQPLIHINIRVCISNGTGNSKQELELFAMDCSVVYVIALSVALYLLFAANPVGGGFDYKTAK